MVLFLLGPAAWGAGLGSNEVRLVVDSAARVGSMDCSDETIVSIGPGAMGTLPSLQLPGNGRAAVDAMAAAGKYIIFSCDVDVRINGIRYADEDLILFDPTTTNYSMFFQGASYGLPEACDMDAVAVSDNFDVEGSDGFVFLSTDIDVPEWNITDDDVLIWWRIGAPAKQLDGRTQLGIPERANLDALHYISPYLYYSLDTYETIGPATARDRDAFAWDGSNFSAVKFEQIEPQANLAALDYPMDRDHDWLTDFEEASGIDEGATTVPGTTVPLNPNGHKTKPDVADSDGDGVPDGEEAAAGTNPNDLNDYLQLTTMQEVSSNQLVSWASVAGRYYDLEAITNWFLGHPSVVADDVQASGATTTRTNVGAQSILFYRVRLEPR